MPAEKKRRPPVRKSKPKTKPKTKAQPKKRTGKKRSGKSRSAFSRQLQTALAGVGALVLIVVLAGLLARIFFPGAPTETSPPEPARTTTFYDTPEFEVYPEEVPDTKTTPDTTSRKTAVVPPETRPMACIIIDDMGYDQELSDKFLALDAPLTLSILPFSPFRKEIIAAAVEKNMEIMLHLPMEPDGYPKTDPGAGALLTTMSPDELIRQLTENIRSVPGAVGANNHMGSKMTTISSQMYQIFSILKREGLFFIDSRTTVNTLCKPSARLLQVPFAERDVFLDHETTEDFVRKQVKKLIRTAQKEGRAVGIGHPHEVTYEVLREMLPELKKKVRLVPASQVVEILG